MPYPRGNLVGQALRQRDSGISCDEVVRQTT